MSASCEHRPPAFLLARLLSLFDTRTTAYRIPMRGTSAERERIACMVPLGLFRLVGSCVPCGYSATTHTRRSPWCSFSSAPSTKGSAGRFRILSSGKQVIPVDLLANGTSTSCTISTAINPSMRHHSMIARRGQQRRNQRTPPQPWQQSPNRGSLRSFFLASKSALLRQ
ncbi:hypothetical protein DFH06DRAFT_1184181 [Mycena polygramma]|nr:hypothetical protein DFH06DRAFT_1184181 [Mycena polygramma]